jgi:hypothetical protein
MEALSDALNAARRKRDSEQWCFTSAAAVFSSKPYEKNHIDLKACAERLLAATVVVDAAQEKIEAEHTKNAKKP